MNTAGRSRQIKGGQYAKFVHDHWYYLIDFVGAGFFNYPFHGWVNPYLAHNWNHLIDYMAGAANEN